MRGKKTDCREGAEFTALIGSTSDWSELVRALQTAINGSPLKRSGLQPSFQLRPTPELFFKIHLCSTGTTTVEQVKELLLSIPGVKQVRDLQMEKVKWSEAHHDDYYLDMPESPETDVAIPADIEFEGESAFPMPTDGVLTDGKELKLTEKHTLRNKRLRNAKAAWLHRTQPNHKADVEGRRNKPPRKSSK